MFSLAIAEHPPDWEKRRVDDTQTILKKANAQAFTDHLSSVGDDIKYTSKEREVPVEEEKVDVRTEKVRVFLDKCL